MPACSSTHLLLIPTYNTGEKLVETVRDALQYWSPVCVVIDGSTDGSRASLIPLEAEFADRLIVLELSVNQGKGQAVLTGLRYAVPKGFTHVLTMDADGQHPADAIPQFMQISAENPQHLILGLPVFDDSAPLIRLRGRRIANWWARLETLSNIGDCLFGFRVYPAQSLLKLMEQTQWGRRFDFDPEMAMRLIWAGHDLINVPATCRYLTQEQGGVSHFNYYRDNVYLSWMYARLLLGFVWRLPNLIKRRMASNRSVR